MAIAKIIYKESANATPQVWMDVTQKTVTNSKLLTGATALKNDGTDIVGTLPDVPVFTINYDNQYNVTSMTCNKTFNEVLSLFLSAAIGGAVVQNVYSDNTIYTESCTLMVDDWDYPTTLICTIGDINNYSFPFLQFEYTATTLTPPVYITTLDDLLATQNGDYYPDPGTVYSHVYVNVPERQTVQIPLTITPSSSVQTITTCQSYVTSIPTTATFSSVQSWPYWKSTLFTTASSLTEGQRYNITGSIQTGVGTITLSGSMQYVFETIDSGTYQRCAMPASLPSTINGVYLTKLSNSNDIYLTIMYRQAPSASETPTITTAIDFNLIGDGYLPITVNAASTSDLTLGTFSVTLTTSNSYGFCGYETYVTKTYQHKNYYLPLRRKLTNTDPSVTTGAAIKDADGYMVVEFWGSNDSFWPSVSATSGTAVLLATAHTSTQYSNMPHNNGACAWYRVSDGAALNFSTYNNN